MEKMKAFLYVAPALALLGAAACAPAKPTQDPAAIQASAVAAANTMVALTQAAVPTETPVPPTPPPSPTPLPSPTLLALPTLPLQLGTSIPLQPSPVPPGGGTTGDVCSGPMAPKPAGPAASVQIKNITSGSVILSLYLQKTDFGECGYRSFNLSPKASTTTSLPQGCYYGGAFVTGPKADTKAFGNGCFKSDRGSVTVDTEVISITSGG